MQVSDQLNTRKARNTLISAGRSLIGVDIGGTKIATYYAEDAEEEFGSATGNRTRV